jgi:hypothetical protein
MNYLERADNLRAYAQRAWADRNSATAMILNEAAATIETMAKRLSELEAAASVALPALLECAEALEDLADMVSEAGQYMTAQSGMTAARLGESRDKARAALDALSKDTP